MPEPSGPTSESGGWGLVRVDARALVPIPLSDGAVVGSAPRGPKLEGDGVAPEHVRATVRTDGCYIDDLGSAEGTFVEGVRVRRARLEHGNVVRLGRVLTVFVERDLASYGGRIESTGPLVHGAKQRRDWIDVARAAVQRGSSVYIEGAPGLGRRSLARLLAQGREGAGPIAVVEAGANGVSADAFREHYKTWVVLEAERLAAHMQYKIAGAVSSSRGAIVIATAAPDLGDRALQQCFFRLFGRTLGVRVRLPRLEERREDIPALARSIADRRGISVAKLDIEHIEMLMRAPWPGGVPQLELVVSGAAEVPAWSSARPRFDPRAFEASDPDLKRARLADALARTEGSMTHAAALIATSRQSLYRQAKIVGLDIARVRRSARRRCDAREVERA